MFEITDKHFFFLILYFMAHAITISSCYAYFYFSSTLISKVNKAGLKKVVLLLPSYILFIILTLLLPLKLINIGFRLANAREWKDGLVFLIVIIWLAPPAVIGIYKNMELKKRKNTKKNKIR